MLADDLFSCMVAVVALAPVAKRYVYSVVVQGSDELFPLVAYSSEA